MTSNVDGTSNASQHPFYNFVNPNLAVLMHCLHLDKVFVKGQGCYLEDNLGQRYLDFLSNFGVLPFGYNPPEIWKAIYEVHERLEPSFVIPSILDSAGVLAKDIVELMFESHPQEIPKHCVTFTNSGAESAEVAIKLARAATNRLPILSTMNGYHGKTLGALSATGKPQYQELFGAPVPGFDFIPYGDPKALEDALKQKEEKNQYAAFIIELVQGEGGAIVPPKGYLQAVREITRKFNVLLIVDEVQTGFGRTGKIFAFQHEDVIPDIITLAKALGGGIMPIGAVVSHKDYFTEYFGLKHSSTFAGGTLACRAGIKTIEVLKQNGYALVKNAKSMGEYLLERLLPLKQQYPDMVKDVRGLGLLIGIEFHAKRIDVNLELSNAPIFLTGIFHEQGALAACISSYLLNVKKIRVAVTLNSSATIRIEPALNVTRELCDEVIQGFSDTLAHVHKYGTIGLLHHLLSIHQNIPLRALPPLNNPLPSPPQEGLKTVCFILNPSNPSHYALYDSSLLGLSEHSLEELSISFGELLEPFVLNRVDVLSHRLQFYFITIPRTEHFVMNNMTVDKVLAELETATDLCEYLEADLVMIAGSFYKFLESKGVLVEGFQNEGKSFFSSQKEPSIVLQSLEALRGELLEPFLKKLDVVL